jgi:hypothetical protein
MERAELGISALAYSASDIEVALITHVDAIGVFEQSSALHLHAAGDVLSASCMKCASLMKFINAV